jgi:hypothetical protein
LAISTLPKITIGLALMQAEKHSPADCALVVAIPVTKEEFERDAALGAAKDFAPNIVEQYAGQISAAWMSYKPFALYLAEVAKYAQDHGVLVKTAASLADWVACLKSRSVVTLVAHCKETGQPEVEFADRLFTPTQIVSVMPNSYAGTLDLTVCYSLAVLVPPIKRSFPDCSVIANKKPALLDLRLALYHQALRLLQSGEYSFVEALATAQLAGVEEKKRQLAAAAKASGK